MIVVLASIKHHVYAAGLAALVTPVAIAAVFTALAKRIASAGIFANDQVIIDVSLGRAADEIETCHSVGS